MFFYVRKITRREVRDGLSQTIFVGEVERSDLALSKCIWTNGSRCCSLRYTTNPINTPPGEGFHYEDGLNGAFGSMHSGGAHFVFGDGHVKFLSENINLEIYQAISTRDAKVVFLKTGEIEPPVGNIESEK